MKGGKNGRGLKRKGTKVASTEREIDLQVGNVNEIAYAGRVVVGIIPTPTWYSVVVIGKDPLERMEVVMS